TIGCRKISSFSVAGCQPRRILLVGDSLIHWVAVHARCSGELDLGLSASVTWRGRRGLRLGQLVDHVRQVLSPLPELCLSHILVHVGTNDVGRGRKRELMLLLNSTLSGLHDLLPNARLIWSNILPRREYYPYSDDDQPRIDRTRLALNKCARSICRRMGGYFVEHPEIRHEHAALFRRDGIHLSPDGNELFLSFFGFGKYCLDFAFYGNFSANESAISVPECQPELPNQLTNPSDEEVRSGLVEKLSMLRRYHGILENAGIENRYFFALVPTCEKLQCILSKTQDPPTTPSDIQGCTVTVRELLRDYKTLVIELRSVTRRDILRAYLHTSFPGHCSNTFSKLVLRLLLSLRDPSHPNVELSLLSFC
ncbi:uncharacterized protein, partial [Diadema setosum]|uniref:uncharacterized protein n=1 Tax=Diadema setosum TaxID=31175 RepID=UPI003B3A9D84